MAVIEWNEAGMVSWDRKETVYFWTIKLKEGTAWLRSSFVIGGSPEAASDRLVAVVRKAEIEFVDLLTGKLVGVQPTNGRARSVQFTSDGTQASWIENGAVAVARGMQTNNFQPTFQLQPGNYVQTLGLNHNGSLLLAKGYDESWWIYDLETKGHVAHLTLEKCGIFLGFVKPGKFLCGLQDRLRLMKFDSTSSSGWRVLKEWQLDYSEFDYPYQELGDCFDGRDLVVAWDKPNQGLTVLEATERSVSLRSDYSEGLPRVGRMRISPD
ncbi:MAG: hypothetical protein N2C14_16545, partial [Planctomycetales bacterium]